MGKKIVYKQAEISDEPIIAEFYKKAFSDLTDQKYPSRFEWMYKNSPFKENNGLLPIWLALDNGKAVGMSSLMYQEFLSNGIEIRGAWCCDLRVLPEYRRMGIATKLEKLRMEGRNVFSVSSSDVSIKLKEHLGYISRPAYTTYIMVNELDPTMVYNDLTRYIHIRKNSFIYNLGEKIKCGYYLARFLAFLFKSVQEKRTAISRDSRDFEVQEIEEFKDAEKALVETVSNTYGLSASRSVEYLNWKYVEQDNMHYQIFKFSQNRKLFCILVIRQTLRVGYNADS